MAYGDEFDIVRDNDYWHTVNNHEICQHKMGALIYLVGSNGSECGFLPTLVLIFEKDIKYAGPVCRTEESALDWIKNKFKELTSVPEDHS